jgi:hypothetical protein
VIDWTARARKYFEEKDRMNTQAILPATKDDLHPMRARSVGGARDTVSGGRSKIERYRWRGPVDEPGEFMWLDKSIIKVDHEHYQRNPKVATEVTKIAADWSWVACGAISVALRDDGDYYAMDGQHRLLAALRRDDISKMPCMVFLVPGVEFEAKGFLRVNTGRRPLTGLEKFRARVTAGDLAAIKVSEFLRAYGYRLTESTEARGGVKCVTLLANLAQENDEILRAVLGVYRDGFESHAIRERVVHGLAELHRRRAADLFSKRFIQRCSVVGHDAVIEATAKAAAYYARGGARVFAEGIANALNKGLRAPLIDADKLASTRPA